MSRLCSKLRGRMKIAHVATASEVVRGDILQARKVTGGAHVKLVATFAIYVFAAFV